MRLPTRQLRAGWEPLGFQSIYVGVHWRKDRSTWQVRVPRTLHGVTLHRGYYTHGSFPPTAEGERLAAEAYDAALVTYSLLSPAARAAPRNFPKDGSTPAVKLAGMPPRTAGSVYKGVCRVGQSEPARYQGSVSVGGTTKNFGVHHTEMAAARAVDRGMLDLMVLPVRGWNFDASAREWEALLCRYIAEDHPESGWGLTDTERTAWDALVDFCTSSHSGPRVDTPSVPAAGVPKLYLVIEKANDLEHDEIIRYCRKSKLGTATMLDIETAHKTDTITVIPFVGSGLQAYTARKLREYPHYMVDDAGLKLLHARALVLKKRVVVLKAIVPDATADVPRDPNFWVALKNALEDAAKEKQRRASRRRKKKKDTNFRKNIVESCGYSCQNMPPRASGGEPQMTTTNMSPGVKMRCLRGLRFLSTLVAAEGYSPRAERAAFASGIAKGNFFEAFAAGLTRGPQLASHMDRENGDREGYDIMAAVTFSGVDSAGPYRVAIFGYTRRCVGDHVKSLCDEDAPVLERVSEVRRNVRRRSNDGRWNGVLRPRCSSGECLPDTLTSRANAPHNSTRLPPPIIHFY